MIESDIITVDEKSIPKIKSFISLMFGYEFEKIHKIKTSGVLSGIIDEELKLYILYTVDIDGTNPEYKIWITHFNRTIIEMKILSEKMGRINIVEEGFELINKYWNML